MSVHGALVRPQQVTLRDDDDKEHHFVLSKIPAIPCREIMAKYPLSALPRLGDYGVNEETMLKLMSYVAVPIKDRDPMRLTTTEAIHNHVPDFVLLGRIEMAMLEYNWSFLRAGKPLYSLESVVQKALEQIFKMWTRLSPQSSPPDTPPSRN